MDWNILYRYVQNDCSEKELRQLGAWLKEDSANEDFFTSFIEEWNSEESINFESDVRTAWKEFRDKNLKSHVNSQYTDAIPGTSELATTKPYSVPHKIRRRDISYWGYSAVAVMLLIVALLFVVQQFKITNSQAQEDEVSYQEISTVRGQRSNLKLSDGSRVVLNAESSLRIPEDYGRGSRILYLEGEAFFDVEHDDHNPFIVVSNRVSTKVLGTQFNISSYESNSTEVAVKKGLVSIGEVEEGKFHKEIVKVTPNKLGILKDVGGLTVSDIEHIDLYVGWTEGKLVFKNTPFSEVLRHLERWFDIDCRVEGATPDLNSRTLTATYDNMPMSEVLKVLSISMDATYTRQGRTIIFREGNG